MCTVLCLDIYVDHYVLFLSRSLISCYTSPSMCHNTWNGRCKLLQNRLDLKQGHLFESWPAKSLDVPYFGLAFRRSVLLLSLAVDNNFDPFLCLIDLSTPEQHKS